LEGREIRHQAAAMSSSSWRSLAVRKSTR
jgi:hypothetical protein